MNVRVDESRQQESAAKIDGSGLRMRGAKRKIVTAVRNRSIADQQAAIHMALERAPHPERIARRMKDGRAQQLAIVSHAEAASSDPERASRSGRDGASRCPSSPDLH